MDVIRIAARRKSIGGDHRDEYRFLGVCFSDEGLPSVADAVVLFFCNNVRCVGLLHRLGMYPTTYRHVFAIFILGMDEFPSPFCITILAFQQGKIDSPKIFDYMLINKFISAYIHIWFS